MASSDTESESELSQTNTFIPFLKHANGDYCDSDAGQQTVSDAITEIQAIKLDTLAQDTSVHEKIAVASNAILSFLDRVLQTGSTEIRLQQRLAIFGQLLDVPFLSVLFEQRRIFHAIAGRSLASESRPSGAIVCWVDAILAKLGDATIVIATGVSLDITEPLFPGNVELRTEDNLRAASQLPSDWLSVAGTIASVHASPAAKRLALRLTFAAFVLGPRFCRRSSLIGIPCEVAEALDRCVGQGRAIGFSTSRAGDQLAIQERLNSAMIISLFAVTDREHGTKGLGDRPPLRPHSLGCLLNLIQNVMHPMDSICSLQLTLPPARLDPPQTILLRWGDTVSWCWETWDDHRVANTETIVFLTVVFLLHSSDSDDQFLTDHITDSPCRPTAASIAMLRVLHHTVVSLSPAFPSENRRETSLPVTARACLKSVQLMRLLLSVQRDDERWIVSGFCKCLFALYVLLADSNEALHIKDYILEALSLVDSDTLRVCLTHVHEDTALRFSARVDQILIQAKKFTSKQDGLFLPADVLFRTLETRETYTSLQRAQLCAVRSALNFATIIWYSETRGCLFRQSVSSVLLAVTELLLQVDFQSLPATILVDAFFNACSAAKKDFSFPDEQRDVIYQLTTISPPSELVMASSFAHYILTSDCSSDSVYCAEAWAFLKEVLLLILKHHFVDEQEPLALLVCPIVCGALLRLLQTDSVATHFMLASPFTLNLCADVKALCEYSGSVPYFTIMKERLEASGTQFLDQIMRKSQGATLKPQPEMQMRLIFYHTHSASHLVFVPATY